MSDCNIAMETMLILAGAKNQRSVWNSRFQEVVDYCRPNADSFTGKKSPGQSNTDQIYDATAVDALEEFATSIHSYVANPTDRYFDFRSANPRYANDRRVKLWCEHVTDTIYHYYSAANSGYTGSMSETFLDIGSFGTSVQYQYWKDGLHFKTFALADCWIKENSDGFVDTLVREINWTARQVMQEFGKMPPKLNEKTREKPDTPLTVIHLVIPRSDTRFLQHIKPAKNFASIWVCMDTKETLKVDGFQWFPFHTPRWLKMSTEVYGRSPALKAMPDIKMLNRLEFQLLKGYSKATDPPLIVPSEAFLVPLKTHPGAVNYKEPGSDPIESLPPVNFSIPENKAEQKREAIRKYFYNDVFRLEKENVEMTAYEAQDRREEKLRKIAPMTGRLNMELLGPQLTLSYLLCTRHGAIDPPPFEIQGGLKIEYSSPAARAQTSLRAVGLDRYIQRLIPAAQINPEVFASVNWAGYSREMALAMGTSEKILYSPEEMEAINSQKAEAEQQQAMVQMAEPASKAIKNLSDSGINLGGMM